MVTRLIGLFRRRNQEADCREVRTLSSDYIDEELEQAEAERVSRHLEWCSPCNWFVETLRATVKMLRATPKREAPSDFRQRVRRAIQDEGRR